MTRLLLTTLLLVGSLLQPARAEPVLVELFTSQGCSSCPPADRVLDALAAQGEVIALAYHVTYWDRLGWTDTLGLAESDRRQRAYARRLGTGVYTPQLVLGGRLDAVGSERQRIEAALRLLQAEPPAGISLALSPDRSTIEVRGPATGAPAILRAAGYAAPTPVAILRGENAGLSPTYSHAVRRLGTLGRWSGGTASFAVPRPPGEAGQVVFLESEADGAVLAVLDLR